MDWKPWNAKLLDEVRRDLMAEKLEIRHATVDCDFLLCGGSMVIRYQDNFFDCRLIRIVQGNEAFLRVSLPTTGSEPTVPSRPKLTLVPPPDDAAGDRGES